MMTGWTCAEGRLWFEQDGVLVAITSTTDVAAAAPAHWPDLPGHLPGASPFVLREWTPYRIEVTPTEAVTAIYAGDLAAAALGRGLFHLAFENSAGAAVLRFAGPHAIPSLTVEVLTRKLGRPGEPFSFPGLYRRLVAEVSSELLTLPFDVAGAAAHATSIAPQPAGPLFALHFLRRHRDRLHGALRAIAYAPHRVLDREEVILPASQARQATPAALRWSATHPREWAETQGRGWFTAGNQAYLPQRILQERAEETFNTPENRFVKYFLGLLTTATGQALTLATILRPDDAALYHELRTLRDELQVALAWPWLQEVGPLSYLPFHSRVLQQRDGYQELFALYPQFLLARTPFGADLERAVAARDVAKLYEYWCFFRLTRALAAEWGDPRIELRPDNSGGLAEGIAASFADTDWKLYFNRSFLGGRGSYSVGLRPDFTLVYRGRPEMVFDAKFRLDAPLDLDDAATAQRSPQAADLYKMHTYRDALRVRAAVALYPGHRTIFFDQATGARFADLDMARVALDDSISGIGAIALRPEED